MKLIKVSLRSDAREPKERFPEQKFPKTTTWRKVLQYYGLMDYSDSHTYQIETIKFKKVAELDNPIDGLSSQTTRRNEIAVRLIKKMMIMKMKIKRLKKKLKPSTSVRSLLKSPVRKAKRVSSRHPQWPPPLQHDVNILPTDEVRLGPTTSGSDSEDTLPIPEKERSSSSKGNPGPRHLKGGGVRVTLKAHDDKTYVRIFTKTTTWKKVLITFQLSQYLNPKIYEIQTSKTKSMAKLGDEIGQLSQKSKQISVTIVPIGNNNLNGGVHNTAAPTFQNHQDESSKDDDDDTRSQLGEDTPERNIATDIKDRFISTLQNERIIPLQDFLKMKKEWEKVKAKYLEGKIPQFIMLMLDRCLGQE